MKISCSARVKNFAERQALLTWVRTIANGGYSEIGETIHLTYLSDGIDNTCQAIFQHFEQYPEHEFRIWGGEKQ